jgi:hypothetical protein
MKYQIAHKVLKEGVKHRRMAFNVSTAVGEFSPHCSALQTTQGSALHYASLLIRTEMEARFKLRVYSETHRDL